MTAWQRTRGRAFNQKLHLFGEVVRYKCRAQEGGIGGSGPRFSQGIWLGFDRRTTENIIFDANNGGIRYARTLISMPDPQKIDVEMIAAVSATPWSVHETREESAVFDKKAIVEQQIPAEPTPSVRGVYVKQEDLRQFGYTATCRKCSSIQLYGSQAGTMPHSTACRERIMARRMENPAGAARVARMTQRQDRFIAEQIERGDKRAQGAEAPAENGLPNLPPPISTTLPSLRPMTVAPEHVETRDAPELAEAQNLHMMIRQHTSSILVWTPDHLLAKAWISMLSLGLRDICPINKWPASTRPLRESGPAAESVA